jgi:hypothetical protein
MPGGAKTHIVEIADVTTEFPSRLSMRWDSVITAGYGERGSLRRVPGAPPLRLLPPGR